MEWTFIHPPSPPPCSVRIQFSILFSKEKAFGSKLNNNGWENIRPNFIHYNYGDFCSKESLDGIGDKMKNKRVELPPHSFFILCHIYQTSKLIGSLSLPN
jgi:hypothetical protein